ncbi:MAG: hypothetical protein IJ460_08850 [Clostridia bacterium]|nr:hypothetical protein [Clostridia bacterium]
MKKLIKPTVLLMCTAFCVYLCTCFEITAKSVERGIDTGINILLPSLFPFFVISDLLTKLISSHKGIFTRIFSALFNMPEEAFGAFVCGIISGYPVGASAAYSLYEQKSVSKEEAERLICFANNSGPLFIICAAGCGMLGSLKAGIIMYAVHITSSVITGIICGITVKRAAKEKTALPSAAIRFNPAESIERGFIQAIKIMGFVIFFAIITDMLLMCAGKAGISTDSKILTMLMCLIEVTNGISLAAGNFDIHTAMCIISFGCGFSGLAVLMQTALVTGNMLCLKKYVLYKLFNAFVSFCLCKIFILASDIDFSAISDFRPEAIQVIFIGLCYILFTYYIIASKKLVNRYKKNNRES